MWTHIEDTRPVARKEHWCNLCERTIRVGERYVRRFGYDENGPVTSLMHERCEALTRDWDEMDWECHEAGEFRRYELGEGNENQCRGRTAADRSGEQGPLDLQ